MRLLAVRSRKVRHVAFMLCQSVSRPLHRENVAFTTAAIYCISVINGAGRRMVVIRLAAVFMRPIRYLRPGRFIPPLANISVSLLYL